jgi:MFS family permease
LSSKKFERTARNPWWIPPHFLGRVPVRIEPGQVRLLGLIALALLFENYDFQVLTAALKHIAEDLEIGEASLGSFMSWIRLGGLPAFLLIPLADWMGRRRLFLVSMVGLSLGTFATAFSQTPLQFMFCQILSRTFMVAAVAVTYVIIAEEFPAEHRGWGIGILGNVVAGRLGDAIGRRVIGFVFLSTFPFFGWLFYAGPGWAIPLAWVLLVFAVMAGNVTIRALATEVFPTAHRGTSTGWLFLLETLGAFVGLQRVYRLTRGEIFDPAAVIQVAFATLVGAFFILLLPETRRQELEAISPDEESP